MIAAAIVPAIAQTDNSPITRTSSPVKQAIYPGNKFIENIGQYGQFMEGHEKMGRIQYGFEGFGMPVLFTSKGLIHLQRKINDLSHREEEKLERQGLPEEEIERRKHVTDRVISMEWLNANPQVEIIAEEKFSDYHTYGFLKDKAYGYKKITYKNLYPGIDLIYTCEGNNPVGFEFSLVVSEGADLGVVKMKYDGDVKKIKLKRKSNLVIRSDIDDIEISLPVCYYGDQLRANAINEVKAIYTISDNIIGFSFPDDYDHSKSLVIDPFVTATGNLTGANAGKAKDVDFDYAGNIYVTGGGDGATNYKLAKYNAAGVLQWTFNGALTIPSWTFGTYYGGWMVEKPSGNIYLGQGFNPATGFQVIRLSTTGLYDNYITTANPNFRENWKMFWSCNSGSPQILIAGGGTNSNINFGVFTPPSVAVGSLNVTGIPYTGTAGWAQDIVDFIIDPANNDVYTLYGSLIGNPSLTNQVYKNTFPYSSASVAWNTPSGFVSVQEIANRPYLAGTQIDNSANIFAINTSYLFYWDGKNLKAFNKATGATVGTPLTIGANSKLMQGGIIADECNNVFVGDMNGTIKVYTFNGSVFNDAAAPDIIIPGFATKSVYDLAYNEYQKLLYASGDGFVSSFDVTSYCANNIYTINLLPDCANAGETATVSPIPPAGSTITYALYLGTTQLSTNTTGVFTGLLPNTTYTIIATINFACSGVQTTTNFVLPGPTIATTVVNTTCGSNVGQVTATGSGTTAPYTYSINGITFQASGIFSGLAAGIYTITVKDANGCKNTKVLTVLNSNGPILVFSNTNATCGNNAGSITANASAGTAPYQYSINGGPYQSSNFFTGLVAGNYILTVKDATGCTNAVSVTITSSIGPQLNAIPAAATCGTNNGTITAFGSSGTAPLEYSINGNIFQAGNLFTNLTPGSYTVTVKDAIGCIKTVTVTVGNNPAPTVTATSTPASCNNINGTVTANGINGVAPLQYSINGVSFQGSNIFTGLAPGIYTITVKDLTGCTGIVSVTVASSNGPTVTATSTSSNCNTSSGTITASASGTIGPYQYSIDGFTFQASGLFSSLAPGNYVVLARDGSGCIGTVSVVVNNVAGPALSASTTSSSCIINNGSITATASGGTAPLQYSIDGVSFQGSGNFTALPPGIYTVTVKDAIGCIKTVNVTVANASGLTLQASSITSSCSSINGSITATASGGTAPLQYSINGVTYQASNVFSPLAPGTYTVYVKDVTGCIITREVVVESVSGALLSVTTHDATCGSSSGVIIASGSSGLAPYQYSINGVTYQASGTFINLAAGTYTVYLKDAIGCIITESVDILSSGAGPGITNFTIRVRNAYPCNTSPGRLTNPVVTGGTAPYTFSLNFGPFIPDATQLFTNLSAGTYSITVMDANGCTRTIFATIINAPVSTASAVVTGTTCNGTTGTIKLTGIGPNTPYHASITGIGGPWIDFDPTYTFTGLAPGTYTIILSDDESFDSGPPIDPGGCLDTITVIVPATGGPSLTTSVTYGTCANVDATIIANGSGGTAPLAYSIDGGAFQPGNVFSSLADGIYIVTVQDATGCENSSSVTVTSPAGLSVTAVTLPASCNAANGSITATGSGGTAPLKYSIDGLAFQSGTTFTNLPAGNYILYVKDLNDCYTSIPITITNTPLPLVTAYTVAASCNNSDGILVASGVNGTPPYQYSINGTVFQSSNSFAGLAAGFYTVYIKDDRGCSNTTGVSVTNSSGPAMTTATTPATCTGANGTVTVTASGGTAPYQYSSNGITYQASNVFTGLLPGTYTIWVKDQNGCIITKTVLVGNVNGPQTLTASLLHAACGLPNGSITATASGGTPAYQYSINGVTYQAGNVFTGLLANSYTLYVKDVNGCIKTLPVVLLNLIGPSLTAAYSPASCNASDGSITATATGGTGVLSYSLNGVTFQASNIFTGLAAGAYTITVKDTRGCTSTASISITNINAVSVTASSTASTCGNPNGTITATGTSGVTPYQYSINGVTYQASNIFTGLAANTYTVTIKDANNCINTTTVTIANTAGATVSATTTSTTCGNSNGTITATGTGGTTPYQYSINGVTYQASNVFTGLAANTYTVAIKDANNCINTTTVTIANTAGATVSATTTASTCGNANGIITATGIGGTTPYQYSINGVTFQASNAFTGLAANTYTVTIKDANNCINTTTVAIANTAGAIVSATSTASTCGNSNGTITATGTGGTTPYQYSINGVTFQASNAFTGLAAITYTVTIKDANNCINTTTVTIANTAGAIVSATSTASTCGNSNGTITATGTGGTTPYQYSINGVTFQASNIFTGLSANTYTVTIKDANNCINITSATIANTSGATVTATLTNASCGTSNGTITATGAGGATPYQYSIDGVTFQGSNVFIGLAANTYTVTIKDANNCINTTLVTIAITTGATVTAIPTNTSCGTSNGTITATGTGGSTPYQYSINGVTFQASNVFTGLAANTYTITIKDANNCINTTSVTIANTSGATVTATSTNTSCGTSNGTITATGTGGATPYQYSINGVTFQASNIFSGLAANTYTVTIKDANNCINTTSVTIANTSGATVTATSLASTCGNSNGTITATGTGGATPYQYSINGVTFQASNIFTGLAANTYTVTIKDANNCINTTLVTIANTTGATVTAIPTNTSCGTSNGTITATGTGGSTPYQYSINGVTFQASNVFTGLAANTYTITIKDANNCINTTSVTIANTSGATVTATSTNTSCGTSNGTITATGTGGTTPYQYSINGVTFQASNIFTGLATNTYTITIKDANNCINTISVTIANTSGATVTATSTNTSCGTSNGTITATGTGGSTPYQYSINGVTYQASNIFTGLAANTYTVTIKDANNCINTTSVTIANTSGATVTATSTNASCGTSNGTITATGTGGSTPYQYSINGVTYQASNIFTGLAANTYTVTIKDANNCINTTSATIANTSGATVAATSTNASCGTNNGTITATGAGGLTPYQFSINGVTYQASNIFTGLAANTYTVTIKDANNCINTTSVAIVNTTGATVTATSTNTSCGTSNGTITATGTGGSTPYQYSIDGVTFQGSNVFISLAANTYTVTIKDANNCINTTTVAIANTSGATVTAASTNTSCGTSNGTITATGTGGATPYQYSINGVIFQSSNIFIGLAANTYTVTIKDANNCINTTTTTISNTSGATVTATSTNTSCGTSNGTITATGTGGATPYQYSINGMTFQASNIFTGLSANTYTITIKDANNCINTTTAIIANTSGATVTATSTNASCGSSNGTITATGTGGTTPYQYSINGVTFQASNIFTGLAANTYTVTIKDANNCINTTTVTIANAVGATVSATSTSSTCGNPNGTITATGAGGVGPYQYSINGVNFQPGNVFTGLAANTYTVTIKDANNCINTTTVTIVNTVGATVSATSTSSTCGNPNGTIIATGAGGVGPYQYSINGVNFQPGNVFTGLAANTYTVTIKDANNCINSTSVTITNIAAATVNATSTSSTCGNANGTITATGTGGAAPYQYSINGITFQASNIFNGLAANTYTVTIKDLNNCINTTSVTITNITGATVTASYTNTNCGASNGTITANGNGGTLPYRYSINSISFQASNVFTGLTTNTYTVTIKDANNCINTTSVTISTTNPVTINAGTDPVICEGASVPLTPVSNGTSYSWTPSTGLSSTSVKNPIASPTVTTTYYVTAFIGTCSKTDTIIVQVNPAPVAHGGQYSPVCFGNNLQLQASGGVQYEWSPSNYLSNTTISNPLVVNPPPGILTYLLYVTDTRHCRSIKPDTVVVKVMPEPKVFAGNDTNIVVNLPFQLQAIDLNQAGFIRYSWSPSFGLNNAGIKNPVATLNRDITYYLTAYTREGCPAKDEIHIRVFAGPSIYVPSAFTPNNDLVNNVFRPILVGIRQLHYFAVYNRYGEQVYRTSEQGKGWDGMYKGQMQNTAAFVWVVEAEDFKGNIIKRKGSVVLIK